jgi:hypothetical protein
LSRRRVKKISGVGPRRARCSAIQRVLLLFAVALDSDSRAMPKISASACVAIVPTSPDLLPAVRFAALPALPVVPAALKLVPNVCCLVLAAWCLLPDL